MGPNPEATGDAHHQKHGVFAHENEEYERATIHVVDIRADHVIRRQIELNAVALEPKVDPLIVGGLLVKVAAYDYDSGHHVQNAENADADHELFEFVRLVAAVFHYIANAKQGHEAGHQKTRAQYEVQEERRHYKAAQYVYIAKARVAYATEYVRFYSL